MKAKRICLLLTILLCMVSSKAFAYDIAVENEDRVTIYYNYINDGKELEVTPAPSRYSGDIVIPSEVTYENITRKVTAIGDFAFERCSSLTSVVIPNSVIYLGSEPFAYSYSLTSVSIGNSVATIGDFAFAKCSSLTSVTIGNSVERICERAFWGCVKLTSITIPNSVSYIDASAFCDCTGITTVISLIVNPFDLYAENCFNQNATLYVPKGTIDKYKALTGWNNFLHIEEIDIGNICATPTISYKDGKLSYNCETEGATCHTTITNEDIKSFDGNEIDLTVTYNISVYATKDDYVDSEVATATLCWIEVNPQNEGITTDVNQIASVAVLIKANGGQLTIEGAEDNTTITAYTLDGVQLGSAVSRNGVATINTNVSSGTVTIVKIGSKSVKIVMQ